MKDMNGVAECGFGEPHEAHEYVMADEGLPAHRHCAGLAHLPTLDAAWAAAEAALPENGLWLIEGVRLVDTSDSDDLNDEQLEWEAEAVDHKIGGQPYNITALGPTPVAALRALAARLDSGGSGTGAIG